MDKPCTPDEIGALKGALLPKEVFQSVNELLAEKYTAGSARILQNEIITRLMSKMDITRAEIFNRGLLNFEEVYRDYGWKVVYDKPDYNEDYEASFTFQRKQ